MHIILDIYLYLGSVNGMGFGRHEGSYSWFHNDTAPPVLLTLLSTLS